VHQVFGGPFLALFALFWCLAGIWQLKVTDLSEALKVGTGSDGEQTILAISLANPALAPTHFVPCRVSLKGDSYLTVPKSEWTERWRKAIEMPKMSDAQCRLLTSLYYAILATLVGYPLYVLWSIV